MIQVHIQANRLHYMNFKNMLGTYNEYSNNISSLEFMKSLLTVVL